MLLTLGIGNAWGAEQTVKWTATSGALGNGIGSGTIQTGTYAWNYTRTLISGSSYTGWSSSCIQLGKNGGVENITFTTSAIPGTIKSVAVECSSYNNAHKVSIAVGGTTYLAATATAKWTTVGTKTGTGSSTGTINISFTGGTRALYIKSITVVYEETSSGGDEPVASLSATPTTIDFGTVYEGATVADKTVAVNFANLTGAVTYSGLSTPFSATGAIAATGDKITISADASTIGAYSQTLTVASTADSKTAEVTVTMNVVEKPAPTGTFTLHTGDLIEGDYVIVSTNALKAEVNSDRLASLPVTISNDEIVDPDATTIWHIAKSGEYWTLYNANKAKYAASTGAKNKAALLDDGSDDKALWSASGTSTYEFVNKKNTAAAVNANLRYNSQNAENSRWACYSTSTGAALSLYRKAGTKYNVNISATTNGTVTASPTSAEAGTTIALTITPDAGYVLDALTVTDASSNTVTVTNNEFTMPASDVTVTATFKLNEKPAATLTLSKNGVEETFPGSWKQDDVVTLPTTVDTDCVKEFVGWSADANCATEPEYAPGASYTLASTSQTLYAVYATVEGGEATASVDMATYANDNSWGSSSSTNQKEININSDLKAVISEGGNSGKYYNDGVRIYQTEDATVTVSTTAGELKSVKFTFTIANNGTLLHEGVAMTSNEAVEVSGNSAVFTVGDTHETENKGQVRFTAIEVVYTGGATYSNYSTTCSAALANPTFSLTEGKYTEAKSVEIEYTEGTVYYTMDGTEPTASSTQYTAAIALNDCGEYTIKAIAISSDSQSDVVSATYMIKLPLTNSQAAPYTEAEAIAVYDGGCYDNQDVYVKGTVKTATFNNTYGNYTITLTNGFQFYRFLQAAETKFTEDIIVPGDVLVACGKLSKYNTAYQLAEGCYLVERIPYEGEKTDISNTEATAYTVDQAFALIADVSSDLTKEVFVKGLVAVAPTSDPTADGQMTYSISDNGENTGNVLKVYLGLNLNGEKFTSKNDVQQGDYVVVKGKLLDYNSTYELNKGNQLVQHVKAATIKIADITMEVGETKTIAATITPDAAKTEVTYSIKAGSDDCITLSDNNITAKAEGKATIVATIATAEGEYMGKTVEFKVTVTPVNIATLSFYFDGGVGDIATTPGMSQKDLGSDYTSADSPKLKFDDTDDNVIIHFDSEPVELSFTLKQNGDNGATYTVYESEDGNTFSPVWVAGEIGYGKTQDVTVSLSDAARYVKFEYTNKITGTNYALGKISITNTYSTPTTLSGTFSVGKYEVAQFATGNLQYNTGTDTWRFAKQQYQFVGEDNIYVGKSDYNNWIDLFGWSADGKFGVNPSNANADYTGTFQDWGIKMGEGWKTLTHDQWDYLLNKRTNASKLQQIAFVNGILGVMLFPDNWICPADCDVEKTLNHDPKDGAETKCDFYSYNYDLTQWNKLEAAGAVFLPAAGRRTGGWGNTTVSPHIVGTAGDKMDADGHYKHYADYYAYYWTSTKNGDDVNYLINCKLVDKVNDDYTVGPAHTYWAEKGRYGQSVRLAKVTSTLIEIGGGDNSEVIEANEGETVNVKVNRTFTANDGYYTICLPFNIDADEIGKAYQINTITEHVAGEGINVEFTEVTTLTAGQPYLLLPSKNLENPIFEGVTIVNTNGDAAPTVSGEGINIAFTGIINGGGDTNGTSDYYVGNGGYLYNGTTAKLGLRAFFTITDNNGNPAKVRARVVVGENTTTGLDNITNGEDTTIKVIENGQLIIIRNGEKFNAQGQKL